MKRSAASGVAEGGVPKVDGSAFCAALKSLVATSGVHSFDVHEYEDLERNNAANAAGLAKTAPLIKAILSVAPQGKILMSDMRSAIDSVTAERPDLRFNRSSYPRKVRSANAQLHFCLYVR